MNLSRRRNRQLNRLLAVLFAMVLAAILLFGNINLVSRQKELERKQITAMAGLLREQLPELSDVERYVMPWCPRSRQAPLPEGIEPEKETK